jgi:hypothetical protein
VEETCHTFLLLFIGFMNMFWIFNDFWPLNATSIWHNDPNISQWHQMTNVFPF